MNIDQMKKIIAKAKEEYGEQKFGVTYNGNGERIHAMDFEYNAAFHNTSDLRTIVNQHEEIERLRERVAELERIHNELGNYLFEFAGCMTDDIHNDLVDLLSGKEISDD